MANNQALIKAKPSLTQQEFSDLWFNHAAIVTLMILYSKTLLRSSMCALFPALSSSHLTSQIHGPLTATSSTSTLDLSYWAGAAEKPPSDPSTPDPEWLNDYYREVVMVDEKRFLDRDAEVWFKRVEPGTVEGKKRVIVEGGKSLIEIPEQVIRVWKEYEERGQGKK